MVRALLAKLVDGVLKFPVLLGSSTLRSDPVNPIGAMSLMNPPTYCG